MRFLTDTLKNRYFSNGEFGVMYDALRDDTMWQDASCVIPSTIDDPVYVLRDISGNNQHLTARDGAGSSHGKYSKGLHLLFSGAG